MYKLNHKFCKISPCIYPFLVKPYLKVRSMNEAWVTVYDQLYGVKLFLFVYLPCLREGSAQGESHEEPILEELICEEYCVRFSLFLFSLGDHVSWTWVPLYLSPIVFVCTVCFTYLDYWNEMRWFMVWKLKNNKLWQFWNGIVNVGGRGRSR